MVCTKCGTKVNERGNPLLPPSQRVIKNHWLVNKCINGYPDSEKARKSLEADLKNIRLNAYQDPTTVATVAAEHFPVNSEERNELVISVGCVILCVHKTKLFCGILVVFCSYLEYNAVTPSSSYAPFRSLVLYQFLHTYFFVLYRGPKYIRS